MRKTLTLLILGLFALNIIACVKPSEAVENLKKSCLYNNKIDYFKRWANTFTEIESYDSSGTVLVKSIIKPIGYFKLNDNSTYSVLSDNVPFSGKWDVTDSCKLVLDPGMAYERKFDVLKLTEDSLTIRRKDGKRTVTQHYVAFKCPSLSQLQQRWDNTSTDIMNYDANRIISYYTIYPNGFFQLNADSTYNRVSDGDSLDGGWSLNNGCQLVLDQGTFLERAFEIQKINSDTLTIWRKDIVNRTNYLQNYKKH